MAVIIRQLAQVDAEACDAMDQERHYIRPTTKSRRERTVVVSEEMGAQLRKSKAQRAAEKLAFGAAYTDEGWICAEPDGSRISPETLSSRFNALERDAGVPHRGYTPAGTRAPRCG